MNNFISSFQMKSNKVVSFSIEQYEHLQEFESTNVGLGVDFKISEIQKKDGKIYAILNLITELFGNTEKGDVLFQIKLNMRGEFDCDMQIVEEEKFKEMLKINGVSTLMQLSRAFITSVTALSGFAPPINFPMVNIYELVKMKEKL